MSEQEYIYLAVFGVIIVVALIIGYLKPSEPVVTKPAIKPTKQPTKKVDAFKIEDLEKLTKAKIDEFGEAKGIKLDRRKTKKAMIEDFKSAIEGNNHKLGK